MYEDDFRLCSPEASSCDQQILRELHIAEYETLGMLFEFSVADIHWIIFNLDFAFRVFYFLLCRHNIDF